MRACVRPVPRVASSRRPRRGQHRLFHQYKEGIGRFLGLEDRLQAIFVLLRAVYWNFRLELMQFGDGSASGVNTNGVSSKAA